jgi:outer membrane protein OmpA-like peptidoglycan-associated protein
VTGGPHGTHRGRVADSSAGAHWWRGHGPTGGGSHAVGGPRRRGAVLAVVLLAVAAIVAVGVGVAVMNREAGSADAAPTGAPGLPGAAPAPVAAGSAVDTAGSADSTAGPALQARLDAVLASAPVRFAPEATDPLPGAGLAPLAEALRAAPRVPVTVEGYTAAVGTDGTRSQALSEERAAEVARRLNALGVDPARLRPVGRADSRPLRTLDESRRVELQVG